MERLFAAASIRNEKSTEVVVKKIINKVYVYAILSLCPSDLQ